MKRILLILSVFITVFSFTSCRFNSNDGILRYDIKSDPQTLDPQAVNDPAGEMVLLHVMEGLVTYDENGEIVTACAESYTVSPDGLTYTFTLKKDIVWSNDSAITADDFVFAVHRLFLPETGARDVSRYMSIKNSDEVYNQNLPVSELGVRADNKSTIVFTLSRIDTGFLDTLASVSALPCNQTFFEASKGKYGTDEKYMLYNNKFVISDWSAGKHMTLRPNSRYRSQADIKSNGINLYTSPGLDSDDRFLNQITDVSEVSAEIASSLDTDKFEVSEFYCTTWMLGFNRQKDIFKNQNLRTAFMLSADRINIQSDTKIFSAADSIIPPSVKTMYSVSKLSNGLGSVTPKQLYNEALKELEVKSLPSVEIICPDYYDFKLYLTYLQKAWLEDLGIAVNFTVLDEKNFSNVLYSGNFDIILFPITAKQDSALGVLECFGSISASNYIGFSDEHYDSLIKSALQTTQSDLLETLLSEAENTLIQTATVKPVFFQKQFIATNRRAKKVVIDPFGPRVYFGYSYKEE